ncbi:MAG: hypothetical protein IPJ82_05840 [Lewinellaceae bacterium]|nr:hypothetical protein [Lewinellaceae bacterium]
MKNTNLPLLLFALFFSFPTGNHAQQSTLHGSIVVQNSQYDKGKVEYVQFAEVDEGSQPRKGHALTDAQGQWRMELVGVAEKSPVFLKIRKEGYQVVNTDGLQAAAAQTAPVRLYMATNKYITDAKRRYYNTGYTEAEKNLTKKLNAKTEELIALQKQTNTDQQKINALQEETTLLQSQYEKLDQFARDLADKYARINLDDAGPLYQDAFRLFQAGDLTAPCNSGAAQTSSGQVTDILEEEKRLGDLKKEVAERDSVKTRRKEDLMQNLRLKADAHRLRFEWDSVGATYAELIRLDSTNYDNLIGYINFLSEQHQYPVAINLAEKALTFIETPEKRFILWLGLSTLYAGKERMQQSENALIETMSIARKLAEQNPEVFLPYLAESLYLLGDMYVDKEQRSQAKKAYTEAADIYRKLAQINPRAHTLDLADAIRNLGNYYGITNQAQEAENAYSESERICRNLAEREPSIKVWIYLSQTLSNLGDFYFQNDQPEKAKNVYAEIEKICLTIATQNPDTIIPGLGYTFMSLGNSYFECKQIPAAEKAYKGSLDIYRALARQNPNTFLPELADILESLGDTYSYAFFESEDWEEDPSMALGAEQDMNLALEAEKAYSEATDIYRRLAQQNPDAFLPELAQSLHDLGSCYVDQEKAGDAEKVYVESVGIYRKLTDKNPEVFLPGLVRSLSRLAGFYLGTKKPESAEKAYTESINICRKLADKNPDVFLPVLAENLVNLAGFYNRIKKTGNAEKTYLEALDVYSKSLPEDPDMAARDLSEIGEFFLYTDSKNAEKSFLKALDFYRALAAQNPEEYTSDIASILIQLESIYIADGKPENAKKVHAEALNISQALGEQSLRDLQKDLIRTLKDAGKHYMSAQEWEKTLNCYGEVMVICHSNAKTSDLSDDYFLNWQSMTIKIRVLKDSTVKRQQYDIAIRATRLLAESTEKMQRISPQLNTLLYYGSLSWYYLFTRQYPDAVKAAEKTLSLDVTQNWARINLGHAWLFQGRWDKAQQVYQEYLKNETNPAAAKNALIKDWDDLEKAGVTHADMAKAREWLNRN